MGWYVGMPVTYVGVAVTLVKQRNELLNTRKLIEFLFKTGLLSRVDIGDIRFCVVLIIVTVCLG